MTPEQIFGTLDNLNRFYTHMARISEMAISKHANLLLNPIIQETANFAHEHRSTLEKISTMANPVANPAPKPEPSGALECEAQKEQEAKSPNPCILSEGQAHTDSTRSYNFMPCC